jgi:hypothetical protein
VDDSDADDVSDDGLPDAVDGWRGCWTSVVRSASHLRRFLATSAVGLCIDLTDVALSLTYCVAYIVETFSGKTTPPNLVSFNVACTAAFFAYFALCLFLSRDRLLYLRSIHTLLDVASMVALVPLLYAGGRRTFQMKAARLLAVTRVSHLEAFQRLAKTDVDRQVFKCVAASAHTCCCATLRCCTS